MYMHVRSSTRVGRDDRNYLYFFYGSNTYFKYKFSNYISNTFKRNPHVSLHTFVESKYTADKTFRIIKILIIPGKSPATLLAVFKIIKESGGSAPQFFSPTLHVSLLV